MSKLVAAAASPMIVPEEVNRVFAPIALSVERFAEEHTLCLDKCARGNAGWELTRPHDNGGNMFLLLLYEETLGLGVGSVWQFPCPEMSLLYSHFRPVLPCALEPGDVTAALDAELQQLAEVPFGYWTHLQPLPAPSGDVT